MNPVRPHPKFRGPVTLALSAGIALTTSVPAASGTLDPGTIFPTIALPRIDDGQPVSITGFRGRRLMLHLFASW